MKDLSKFPLVKKALEQVVVEQDVDNGTAGMEFLAHFWEEEYVFDKVREDLRIKIGKAVFNGNIVDIPKLQEDMAKLPKPKIIMVWRLVEPIPILKGTKVLTDEDKKYGIEMKNVTLLYIPEDCVTAGLLEYEETKDIGNDKMGRETKILNIRLKKGIIDVAAPIVDRFDRMVRPKRAYVTIVSYKSLQVVGQIMNSERNNKRRRTGFDEMTF